MRSCPLGEAPLGMLLIIIIIIITVRYVEAPTCWTLCSIPAMLPQVLGRGVGVGGGSQLFQGASPIPTNLHRPQALPTLLDCPDGSLRHGLPDPLATSNRCHS
jgi:hypothetical protein